MKIKLKESIISELTAVGLRPGMEIESIDVNKTTGAVQFIKWHNGSSYDCVVWPEDYEVVTKEKTVTIPISQISFGSKSDTTIDITLPVAEVTNALDAMHWVFAPYLDNPELSELPWITNLIKTYNGIASILPSPWDLQYEPIETY
jgi:hypothetical protein